MGERCPKHVELLSIKSIKNCISLVTHMIFIALELLDFFSVDDTRNIYLISSPQNFLILY